MVLSRIAFIVFFATTLVNANNSQEAFLIKKNTQSYTAQVHSAKKAAIIGAAVGFMANASSDKKFLRAHASGLAITFTINFVDEKINPEEKERRVVRVSSSLAGYFAGAILYSCIAKAFDSLPLLTR